MTSRIRTIAIGAALSGVLLASPAGATAAGAGYDWNEVSSPAGSVTGVCTFVADVPDQSFNDLTIAIKYEVVADAPAWAVNGICKIRDVNNKVYGSVAAGAPGMYATNAGTVVVPRTIVGAKACNTPEALWLNGTEANPANTTTCTPL